MIRLKKCTGCDPAKIISNYDGPVGLKLQQVFSAHGISNSTHYEWRDVEISEIDKSDYEIVDDD